jgi:hypothetical protein
MLHQWRAKDQNQLSSKQEIFQTRISTCPIPAQETTQVLAVLEIGKFCRAIAIVAEP